MLSRASHSCLAFSNSASSRSSEERQKHVETEKNNPTTLTQTMPHEHIPLQPLTSWSIILMSSVLLISSKYDGTLCLIITGYVHSWQGAVSNNCSIFREMNVLKGVCVLLTCRTGLVSACCQILKNAILLQRWNLNNEHILYYSVLTKHLPDVYTHSSSVWILYLFGDFNVYWNLSFLGDGNPRDYV